VILKSTRDNLNKHLKGYLMKDTQAKKAIPRTYQPATGYEYEAPETVMNNVQAIMDGKVKVVKPRAKTKAKTTAPKAGTIDLGDKIDKAVEAVLAAKLAELAKKDKAVHDQIKEEGETTLFGAIMDASNWCQEAWSESSIINDYIVNDDDLERMKFWKKDEASAESQPK